MKTRRPLILMIALLAGLLLADDAMAQRRGGGGGASRGGSVGRSGGSVGGGSVGRSSGSVGRSSGSIGRSTGSVSRSTGSVSRSTGSVSRSSPSRSTVGSSPSRSTTYGRPTTTGSSSGSSSVRYTYSSPTRTDSASRSDSSGRSYGVPSRSTDSTRSDSGVVQRYESGPIGRATGSTGGSTGADPGWRARDTGRSRPIDDGRVLDLSGTGRAPEVRFPRPATTADGRSVSRDPRTRLSADDAARMRRTLGEGSPAVRSSTVSRSDILQRYQRADGARQTGSGRESGDTRDLRRRAVGARGPSEGRRSQSDAERASAARSSLAQRDADRARNARSQLAERDAGRAKAARAAYAERNADRIAQARQNYLDSSGDGGRNGAGNVIGAGIERLGEGGNGGGGGGHHGGHHGGGYYWNNSYWNYWGPYCGYGWGWYWSWPSYCWGYWWHNYWYYGGYWSYGYCPSYYWYGPWLPWGVSVVYQTGAYRDVETVYVYEDVPQEEVFVEAPAGAQDEPLNRAADYYLTLGDRAFRDGRYADAVHFYAKAVEFAPQEGILYLILSDALLATGDYHYAAYAVRKALELDPALARNVVDKHSFYADPTEFDRQLAVLETYVQDHFLDEDARLVLAANYLFGGRPAAAVDLLGSPFSESIVQSPAGQAILEAARELQYGQPTGNR